jgi:DNA polymerase-1
MVWVSERPRCFLAAPVAVGTVDQASALLLRYRDLATRLKMFLYPITGYVHPRTGRIHAEYWQLGATSGRITSSDPNVQQLPRDRETRSLLTAGPGRVLVIADYSQIELRRGDVRPPRGGRRP